MATMQARGTFSQPPAARWLHRVILLDAGTFTALALVMLAAPTAVAGFLRISQVNIVLALGLVALLYDGGRLFWATARRPLDLRLVRLTLVMNGAWAVGSVVLLAFASAALSPALWWTVAILADVAALFAIVQWLGLRRL